MPATPASLLPSDEMERLAHLRQAEIAVAMREPVFERFVQLAARLFSLPICLISLVEEDAVRYPANHGLPALTEQPRVEAICALVVQQNRVTVLSDLALEDRSRLTQEAHLAAWSKGLRAYAGVPLRMTNHFTLGTLCVIDRQPRHFSPEEQATLSWLGAVVAQTIAVRQLCLGEAELGPTRWQTVRLIVDTEIDALHTLRRYLGARFGSAVPVQPEILAVMEQRLVSFHRALGNYRTMHE